MTVVLRNVIDVSLNAEVYVPISKAEKVKPYNEASPLWHNILVDDGDSEHGKVYEAMKETD